MCDTEPGYVLVHNPCGVVRPGQSRAHEWREPPADALTRGVAVVDNLIPGMTEIAEALAGAWERSLGPARVLRVPHSRTVDDAVLAELARSGLVLLGLGNCGACTTWLAELGRDLVVRQPVALVVTQRFAPVAAARLAALGEPDLPVLAVPNEAADTPVGRLGPVAERTVADAATAWAIPLAAGGRA